MKLAPYKTLEPGEQVQFDEPRMLRWLAMRALTEGIVSSERAADLLGAPLPDPDDFIQTSAGVSC